MSTPRPDSLAQTPAGRRLAVGAEAQPTGGVEFRVWAPATSQAAVLVGELVGLEDAKDVPLTAETGGYWSGLVAEAERRLSAMGAVRMQAVVVETDARATGFWINSGWERQTARLRFVKG